MTDFRDHFNVDPESVGSAELAILKLSEQPRIIMLFTPDCVAVPTHYVNSGTFSGYTQCNQPIEGKCLLCETSKTHETRIVLPVYDVESDAVAALLISDTRSPHSLGPKLRAVLDAGKLDERFIMISRHAAKYEVKTLPIPAGAETGEIAIAAFLEHIRKSHVTLESAIPIVANKELAEVPEIARKATALGVTLTSFGSKGDVSLVAING